MNVANRPKWNVCGPYTGILSVSKAFSSSQFMYIVALLSMVYACMYLVYPTNLVNPSTKVRKYVLYDSFF